MRFRVEVLEKDFPYEEITQLLHDGYREHLESGRNYLAAVQSVEQTKERLNGAYCVVAYDEEKLVGTLTFRIYRNEDASKRKWYEDDVFISIFQLAVDPAYRNTKLLALMGLAIAKMEFAKECKSIIVDTSEDAHELVDKYLKMGFRIVDYVSWESTNYYSYIFRKGLNGNEFSENYCKFRYGISKALCVMRYKKDGKRRFLC